MSITITDSKLLEQLSCASGAVELKAPDGSVLGKFIAEEMCRLPPGVKSPFTEEEMAERRKDRTGRPLDRPAFTSSLGWLGIRNRFNLLFELPADHVLGGDLEEPLLAAHAQLTEFRPDAPIAAVRHELPRLRVVG